MAEAAKKVKREKLKLLASLLLPEGAKVKDVIDKVKAFIKDTIDEKASVKKAPEPE